MFKLLITGNGFDIASGLPTKYENFLAFMEELKAKKSQEIENYTNEYERIMDYEQDHVITYENICEKAEEIEKKLKSEPLIQAYWVFLKYYETFNKNKTICLHSDEALNCKEIIRKLEKNEFIYGNHKVKLNYLYNSCLLQVYLYGNEWLEYFYSIKVNQKRGDNWVDFEKEIFNVVYSLENKIKENDDEIREDIRYNEKQIIDSGHSKKVTLVDFMNQNNCTKNLSYHELAGKNGFIARLWSEFRIFVTCLETYMFFVNQVPTEFLKDIAEMDKFKKVTWQLNFNYTDTFRHMLKEKKKKMPVERVDYIHGRVGRNNIIIGIDESLSKGSRNKFLECSCFKKYFQRILFKTGLKYRSWLGDLKKRRCEVFIFGHSLDKTDGDALKYILLNKSVSKTTIYYYDEKVHFSQINNLTRIIGKKNLIDMVGKKRIVFVRQQ